MRKYLPHVLIISFVLILAPTAQVASYAESGLQKVELWKEYIRKNPDDAGAHLSLGYAYVISGKLKEAIESYKQALRIDPDYTKAHYNLGVAYLQLNDRGSALEEYKILKKLDTEMAIVGYHLQKHAEQILLSYKDLSDNQ